MFFLLLFRRNMIFLRLAKLKNHSELIYREIPQYRVENSMNTETAWMDKTKYRTELEAAKLPKYLTKNTPSF